MPFEPGHKKAGGRPKGSKNKDSVFVQEKAKELGINPFEVLLYFAAGDWKSLGYKSETFIRYGAQGIQNEEFTIEPNTRAKAAGEACQYLYPKLKAVEHSGAISTDVENPIQVVLTLPKNGSEKV